MRALDFLVVTIFAFGNFVLSLRTLDDSNPTARPTLLPRGLGEPTVAPTQASSVIPTQDPTTQPTIIPSAILTAEPSILPSANPTGEPTVGPSAFPTVEQTVAPSAYPTIEETVAPSAPTHKPSRSPTHKPTKSPTEVPSKIPSAVPSVIPTADPTETPTPNPTAEPSVSFYPSSMPTSNWLPRYFQCGALTCEDSDSPNDCSYASGNVILECVNERTPCVVSTEDFYVGPHTSLTVQGGCELAVAATGSVFVFLNSTIKAASIAITAALGNLVVFGSISTSGQGPLIGPGSPPPELAGQGGAYGGSAGKPHCNNTYFSTIDEQLGSINVLDDIYTSSINYNATFGSGGGVEGAGRGGGRIILKTLGNVIIEPTGSILADGSSPEEFHLGAGSGGSIVISSNECVLKGKLSAVGGSAKPGHNHAGAGGGGGRIAIVVQSLNSTTNSLSSVDTNIHVRGGLSTSSHCTTGSSGTAYIQLGHGGFHLFNAALMVSNGNQRSFAVSMLDTMPPATNVLSVSERAVITSKKSLHLNKLNGCAESEPSHTACSSIHMINSTFVALQNTTEAYTEIEGTIFGLTADEISIMNTELSGQIYTHYSFNVSARNFFVSENSTMFFSGSFIAHADEHVDIQGLILQIPGKHAPIIANTYNHRAAASITAEKNVTFGNLITTNFRVRAEHVHFLANKFANSPFGFIPQACQEDIPLAAFSCNNHRYTGTLKFNNTFVIIGTASITFGANAQLEAAQVLLCAPDINIGDGAAVSANQRGCAASHGPGTGLPPSAPNDPNGKGGGGAGYGGVGGYGFDNVGSGGSVYDSVNVLNSGSGGGCYHCNLTYSGAGGGIINIVAYNSLVLNGNLSSNGGFGSSDAGGGSGGTVSINALAMSGRGYITVWGGGGGSGYSPGGGGGGGVLTMFNPSSYYLEYNYVGVVSALGGPPGHFVLGDATASTNLLDSSASTRRNLVAGDSRFRGSKISAQDDSAISGQDGVLNLPTCPAGYGNGVSTGTVCGLCPVGTYSSGDGFNICYQCDNKPTHSSYTNTGVTDNDCPYECNSGYSTKDCYTPFQNFLFNTLGVVGLVLCSIGIFAIIFMPLLYLRYKREYSWYEDHRKIVLPTDTFTHVDEFRNERRTHGRRSSMDESFGADYTVENPLAASESSMPSETSEDLSKVSSVGGASQSTNATSLPKAFQRMNRDLRLRFRMGDHDLPQHACRVNFLGSNHPSEIRGGQWILPSSRPPCMRPMLRRAEYRAFAEKINKRMEWKPYGIEMITFYTIAIIAPPLAAFLMRQFRKRRANLLLKLVANYDYACFRCPVQRASRSGLRVGISPDATLAYVDFLFDEEKSSSRMKPLCPLGQVKLPATFRLAGLGTYSSPYYVDTNDLILQAVPQTDIPSSFINEAWISFVVELNTVLRTVQTDSLFYGIRRLIRFLSEEQHVTNLGGLVVEFCTFSNIETVYASEISQETPEETAHRTTSRMVSVSGAMPRARNTSWEKWIMKQRTSDLTMPPMLTSFSNAPIPADQRPSDRSSGQVPNSVDLQYTSPQMSIDIRETFVEKSVTKVFSCAGYLRDCAVYIFQLIMTCLCMCRYNNSLTLSDPVGYALSFMEMVKAIRRGQLKMGIIVTHPKVVNYNYIVQDEDYESEDDSYYQDSDGPRTRMMSSQDSESYKSSLQSLPHIFSIGNDAPHSAGPKTPLSSSKTSSALRRTYGDKADEVAKFYNIMIAADSSIANSSGKNDSDKVPSAGSSPVAQSTLASMISAVKDPTVQKDAESTPNSARSCAKEESEHAKENARATPTPATPCEEGYTDLSPFRHSKMRRPSEMHMVAKEPGENELETSVLGRLTEDDIRTQSMHEHDNRRKSNDSRDSTFSDEEVVPDRSKSDTDRNTGGRTTFAQDESQFSHSRSGIKAHLTSPVAIDRKSVTASGRKSKRHNNNRKNWKDLSTENLANSGFQAPVNSWRIDSNGDIVSDGLLRIQEESMQSSAGRSFSDASAASSTSSNAAQSSEASQDFAERMNNESSLHIVLRTPTLQNRPSSLKSSAPKSPWFDIRTFMGVGVASSSKSPTANSNMNSLAIEPRPPRGEVMSVNSSDIGSITNHDNSSEVDSERGRRNHDLEAGAAGATALERDRQVDLLTSAARRKNSNRRAGVPATAAFQPSYMSGLLFFYIRSFMFGANVYPIGPKYLHKVFELVLFALCLVDIALSIIVLVSAFCASHDATSCEDHTSMILMVTVWPGALTIAPIMGLIMVILGPSGTLARMYALWSRIAFINSAMVIWSLVYYYDYYSNIANSYYPMLLLPSSRVFQCLVVDLYIAHIEKLRYTRGWDGLHTSLFKTQDNLQEVNA